jgi:dienelactone hydrolase
MMFYVSNRIMLLGICIAGVIAWLVMAENI